MVVKRHFIYNLSEVNIFAFKKTAERQHSVSNILSVATCSDNNYLKKRGKTTWTMAQLTSVSPIRHWHSVQNALRRNIRRLALKVSIFIS